MMLMKHESLLGLVMTLKIVPKGETLVPVLGEQIKPMHLLPCFALSYYPSR